MKLKGSIILEASYVFPLTLIAIFIILLFAYYKHDNLVFRSGMRRYLMRSQIEEKDYDFEEERLPLYYMEYRKVMVEKGAKKGRMTAEVSFDIYPRFLYFDGTLREKKAEEFYKVYCPEKVVRKLSVFSD